MQDDENRMTDVQENAFESHAEEEEAALRLRLAERREARRIRQEKRKRAERRKRLLLFLGILMILGVVGFFCRRHYPENTEPETEVENTTPAETEPAKNEKQELLAQAARQAQQYDYDGAITLLTDSAYAEDAEVQAMVTEYTDTKAACTAANNQEITHIFVHSLIVDKARALTDDRLGHNFNSTMTTISEFEAILEQLYERNYVLVGLHDIAATENADGTERMVQKQILLPEGKKPIVISQDDVCYYEYMKGRGFADKMVLDDAGKPKLQYTDAEGNVSVGDYDLVPILDAFVEAHPDFSYHGHKAILAFTGYNGILGYRTDETYDPNSENYDSTNTANENIAADRETVKALTQALAEDGYEFASHSWGHINFTERSLEDLTRDTERWKRNVEPLLPESCDILLYPFGADIKDWHAYDEASDAKYQMLHDSGFRYFCTVDSTQYWVQFGADYMRQGRRNLDGYRLYESYSGAADRVSDLMDVQQVFDTDRPTPITWN